MNTYIRHGRYHTYTSGQCRSCDACRNAATLYNKNRELHIARGTWQPWSDPGPVRAHVQKLRAHGLGDDTIATLAGVAPATIDRLMADGATRIRTAPAQKILAVRFDLDALPATKLVASTGSIRRLQALVAAGWSLTEQARRLGTDRNTLAKVFSRPAVTVARARAIRDLYRQLRDQAPADHASATRALRYAAANNWPGPDSWDDALIDLPAGLAEAEAGAA